jgi:hypothetical protein
MTRFDYNNPETVTLAIEYYLDTGKCPECLSLDIEDKHFWEDGSFSAEFVCKACGFTVGFGRPMSKREYDRFVLEMG